MSIKYRRDFNRDKESKIDQISYLDLNMFTVIPREKHKNFRNLVYVLSHTSQTWGITTKPDNHCYIWQSNQKKIHQNLCRKI